jgi:hypothetical protein
VVDLTICPDCGRPKESHNLYKSGLCPVVRINIENLQHRISFIIDEVAELTPAQLAQLDRMVVTKKNGALVVSAKNNRCLAPYLKETK